MLFGGLNPRPPTAKHDDQTIKRCVGYARAWGYDRLLMGNLHAHRVTEPSDLLNATDPCGPRNAAHLRDKNKEQPCARSFFTNAADLFPGTRQPPARNGGVR